MPKRPKSFSGVSKSNPVRKKMLQKKLQLVVKLKRLSLPHIIKQEPEMLFGMNVTSIDITQDKNLQPMVKLERFNLSNIRNRSLSLPHIIKQEPEILFDMNVAPIDIKQDKTLQPMVKLERFNLSDIRKESATPDINIPSMVYEHEKNLLPIVKIQRLNLSDFTRKEPACIEQQENLETEAKLEPLYSSEAPAAQIDPIPKVKAANSKSQNLEKIISNLSSKPSTSRFVRNPNYNMSKRFGRKVFTQKRVNETDEFMFFRNRNSGLSSGPFNSGISNASVERFFSFVQQFLD